MGKYQFNNSIIILSAKLTKCSVGVSATLQPVWRCSTTHMASRGGSATSKAFGDGFNNSFLALATPRALRVVQPPPDELLGVAETTPWQSISLANKIVTKILNLYLPIRQVPSVIQIETQVKKLKKKKKKKKKR
jgi:hypothetical protein